jgi:feruloyl esterase
MGELDRNPFRRRNWDFWQNRVYEQCDAKDGLKDGLIDDPRACNFNPASRSAALRGRNGPGRLLHERSDQSGGGRIYGDVMSQGKRFSRGWPGGRRSRRARTDERLDRAADQRAEQPAHGHRMERTFCASRGAGRNRNLNLDPIALFRQFDIDKDPGRMDEFAQILDATDTDLSAFRQRGGKMMMYFWMGRSAAQRENGRGVHRNRW